MKKITFLIVCCIMYAGTYAQSWSLTGNTGTTPGTNFLGTTDAKALMFKVNNQRSAYIDFAFAKANTSFGFQALKNPTGNNNAAFGYKASFSNTSGIYNTSLGAYALFFNTTGYSNVAAGVGALYKNTGISNLVAIGDSALYNNGVGATDIEATGNTAIGSKALYLNTTGFYNTATGYNALLSNTSGGVNTATGYNALISNTTGGANTATGTSALQSNTIGYSNTATGTSSLSYNSSGTQNTATGNYSLYSNTTGSSNTANGNDALYSNTTGYHNTASGEHALYLNKTGFFNTASGSNSLYFNNSGSYNVATGNYALYNNTIGHSNIASGYTALYGNTKGYRNIAIGKGALYKNTIGHDLIAIGDSALYNQGIGRIGGFFGNDTFYYNVAIGTKTLFNNTSGDNNIAIGNYTMYDNTTGYTNVAIGSSALTSNTYGLGNTAIGEFAMFWNESGYYNTSVGSQFGGVVVSYDNNTTLGYDAYPFANNAVRIGNSSVTSIGGQVGWTNYSDERVKKDIKENVPGLQFIKLLRPLTYHFSIAKQNELIGRKNDTANWKGKYDIEKINYTGFLAQEVDKAARKINYDFSGVDKSGKIWGLRYSEFVVPLVKAVQELSGNNDSLREVNNQQQQQISNMQLRLDKVEQMLSSLQQNFNACNPCNAVSGAISSQQSSKIISVSSASLEQNIPNPFNHTTTINYTLPSQYSPAKIIITDKSGKVLKEVNISGSGNGSLKVDAFSLSSGAYQYSLYIDGKLINTKQMILTK